jgi:hypothetical protein
VAKLVATGQGNGRYPPLAEIPSRPQSAGMGTDSAGRRVAMSKAAGPVYGAAALAILILAAQDMHNALLWLHDFSISGSMFVLGLAGVALATAGPFAMSLWCWRLAARLRPRWAVHLLFIPCAYAMVRAGASVLDYADGAPWTDEPAGYALIAAYLLFPLTFLVHAAALAFEAVAAIRRRAKAG